MDALNVTDLLATFKRFSDVGEFRWKDGDVSTADLATVKWDKQLPVLTDGMSFEQADPTKNSVKGSRS